VGIFRRRRRDNPFEARGDWFKGALHARAPEPSDPSTLAALVRAYAERHFAFVFVTGLTDGPPPEAAGQKVVVLPGFEASLREGEPWREFRFVGLGSAKRPDGDFASPGELLKAVRASAPFTMLAHPCLSNLSGREIAALEGLDAIEIYNRLADTRGRGSSGYALDWCLGAARRLGAVAVDDADDPADAGRAWVMLRAKRCEPGCIVEALRGGRFYSSCGPEVFDVRVRRTAIDVRTSPCRCIRFICDDLKGRRIEAPPGETIAGAEYRFRGGEGVIRIECVDADGRQAWTNPLYF
jgi:hypothetical protein